jgi:hypothetical protein
VKPKRFAGSFEFRDGAGGSAVWEIGGISGTVTLPGCARPMPVILLPGDAFDGVPRLVFSPPARGAAALARIVAPGATVLLPDCSSPLSIKALDTTDGVSKAVPLSQAGPYALTARILEAGPRGDEILSEASARLTGGQASTLETRAAIPGVPLGQGIRMSFAVVAAGDDDALLACSLSVTRDVEPAPGDPPVTIRIARADESLRLVYGKPERITVSPVYGGGRSALVLEVTLGRIPAKR